MYRLLSEGQMNNFAGDVMKEIDSLCKNCRKKGFRWARGTCQYCGHKQYEDSIFLEDRKIRNKMNKEALEAYESAKRKPEQQFINGDIGFGEIGGDCGVE